MKTLQAPQRSAETKVAQATGKKTNRTVIEKNAPEDSCGVRQCKDGVVFTASCPGAAFVQLAGDFNNWQPHRTEMEKVGQNGFWKIKLPLVAGTYRYRFVVDGHWRQDPFNEAAEPNPYGELNSVVRVR